MQVVEMAMITIIMVIKDKIIVTSITNITKINGLLIIEMIMMQDFMKPTTIDQEMVLEAEILEEDSNSIPITTIMVISMAITIDKITSMIIDYKRIEVLSRTLKTIMIKESMKEIITMTSMVQITIQVSNNIKMVVTIEINKVKINNNGSKTICMIDQTQIEVVINSSFISTRISIIMIQGKD